MLGNRFIVVEMSEVNLIDVDPNYVDSGASAAKAEAAAAAAKAEEVAVAARAEAAATLASRKQAHETLIVRHEPTALFSLASVFCVLPRIYCCLLCVLRGERLFVTTGVVF